MERDLLIRLVTKAQNGNNDAMNQLFANFYNDVYYFALKTVKDSDTACDITQETFLEIINTIGNLKEPAAFVTWMKQITYHQCTRYFKKKKDVLVEEDEDGNTIFDTLADESEGSIPAEVYEKEEFRNTILGIINELTEEQRAAVMMYYFDELAVGTIARIQGVSEGTVKSRLNYARKAIKKSVEAYEKKHDVRLHSFSILPLLLLFFGKEAMPVAKAAEIGAVVSTAAGTAGAGAAAAAGAVASSAAGTSATSATAAATAGGIAAKASATSIVTKVIAGVLAATVAVGGGIAVFGGNGTHACKDVEPNGICDICGVDVHHGEDGNQHWDPTDDDIIYPCTDENMDCTCDVCHTAIHYVDRSLGHDAFCTVCGASLGFESLDSDMFCDICGQLPCGEFHHEGHYDEDFSGTCQWCGIPMEFEMPEGELIEYPEAESDEDNEPEELAAPEIILVINDESTTLFIDSVVDVRGYEIYINGACVADIKAAEFRIERNSLNVGLNEVYVRAYSYAGFAVDSEIITFGKLADPQYTIDGTTKVVFPWGDVENAQGYIIYGDDGEYLTTIELGESFDFASVYTSDGFYFPYIQAYAVGWVSSEKCGIPVAIGGNGGPIGTP